MYDRGRAQHRLLRSMTVRSMTRHLFLGLLWLLPLVLNPLAAVADPLDLVAPEAVVQARSGILDDTSLWNIRGRGAEGPKISATSDVAVILWDELKQWRQQGQQGTSYSQTVGSGNVQTNSLVTNRN